MTGTYDLSFYLAGIFIGASGIILFMQPLYKCVRRKKEPDPEVKPELGTNGEVKQNGKLLI